MAVDWLSDEPGLRFSKTISSPTEAYSFPKCCVRISAQTASRRASSSAQSDACNVPALQALARRALRAHRRAPDGRGRDDGVLCPAEEVARRTEQGTESRLDGSEIAGPSCTTCKTRLSGGFCRLHRMSRVLLPRDLHPQIFGNPLPDFFRKFIEAQ